MASQGAISLTPKQQYWKAYRTQAAVPHMLACNCLPNQGNEFSCHSAITVNTARQTCNVTVQEVDIGKLGISVHPAKRISAYQQVRQFLLVSIGDACKSAPTHKECGQQTGVEEGSSSSNSSNLRSQLSLFICQDA